MMFGLEGIGVPMGLILSVLSTCLCIVYGIINWNTGYITEEELAAEKKWKEEEKKVEEAL